MDINEFWNLIDESQKDSIDCEQQSETLAELLKNLEASEIVSFEEHFNKKLVESFSWELWGVAYLINGGCSDDGFLYFRGWLISQGKDYFDAALENPENGANNASPDEFNECESILYVARQVFEEKTGNEISSYYVEPNQPSGKKWQEENLEEIYPKIAEKFV